MDVLFTPEIQQYLEAQVKAGRFASIDDAVNGLLSVAKMEEELTPEDVEELRAEIELGLEDVKNGDVAEWDAEDLKRRVRDHLSGKRAG